MSSVASFPPVHREENGGPVTCMALCALGTWHSEMVVGQAILAMSGKNTFAFVCDRNAGQISH
jgi:hypothetical protein